MFHKAGKIADILINSLEYAKFSTKNEFEYHVTIYNEKYKIFTVILFYFLIIYLIKKKNVIN